MLSFQDSSAMDFNASITVARSNAADRNVSTRPQSFNYENAYTKRIDSRRARFYPLMAFAIAAFTSTPVHAAANNAASAHHAVNLGAANAARRLATAAQEMHELRQLGDGWDGVRSLKPARRAIDNAVRFLGFLPPSVAVPEPSPAADGTVGWYWHTNKAEISVFFFADGRVAYYGELSDQSVTRGVFRLDDDSAPQDLLEAIAHA